MDGGHFFIGVIYGMANLLETYNKKMQERGYTLDTNGKYTKSGNNYTVGGNSGRNTYTSASNKTKSAYQKMLSDEDEEEEEEERERVRSSKRMTNQEVVSKIYEMSKTDKEAANNALSMYRQLQNDPTSAYYNPYRNSTNSALTTLSELGADVSKIDDDWIEGYSWLKEHYLFNGTSNTPSKPGKNASVEEIAAYNYYQVLKSEGQTRKAEQEWAALQEEIKYWTNRSDRNYSDDEILGKINWNNYKTLTAMDESAAQGTPMELNRGIGYSRDNLYGVIWQARNGRSSGSLELDSAMNYTGEGNRWKEDRNISERLDPNSGRFNPYTVGSTLEQEGLYFGQNSFDQSWIDGNREYSYGSDKNSQQNFRNVVEAERTTQAAEKELANVREKMTSLISNSKSPEDAKLKLEEYINSNCPTLKKMNDSLTDGKLLNTTRAIDFDLNDLKAEIDTGVLEQKEKEEAWERELDETVAAGKTSEPAIGPKQVERFTDEQLHLDMNDEDALEAFRQEKGQTGSQTSPDRTAQSTAENAAASLTEEESAFMRERRRAKNNAYRQSADILGDEKTAAEENMYERGNVINFGDTVNRIRGMIDQASDYVSYAFGKYTSRASTNFFNTTLKTHQEITDYEAQKSNLEALQLRSDELASKLGDKVYAVGDSAPYSMRTTMDINGRDLEVLMERSTDGSGFVIRQYHDPETGDYYNPNGGGTLSEEDFFAQYDRELVNSKVDASLAGANEFYQKKLDAFLNAPALTEEDQRDLEELQNLSGRIQEAQSYMKEHQTAYDEATEAMTKATKAYDDSVFVLNLFGGDTSALAKNKAIADYVTSFDKYEGTQWAAYNSYNLLQDMYIESTDFDPETGTFGGNSLANAQVVWKAAKEGGDKNNGYVVTVDGTDFVLSNGKDELTEMLADVSFARDYLAEHPEIEVPENYLTNLDRFAGKIEREIKGYDYFLLTANDDYTAKVDEGRELDKQNKGVDWANFDINVVSGDMMGSLDSLPNSNYMTVMEREAYYYLLATEGKESAMEFYNYLADEQYGVLPVRFTEDVQGFGRDWAKEGLGGFVMSNAVAIASAPVRFLGSGLWYLNSAISGQELNPNSALLAFNNFTTATREASREAIDEQWEPGSLANKVANIGYEIATNRGDSVMMAGIFGNLIPGFDKLAEPAQEFFSALPMGISAAGDAGADIKRRHGSDTQAWLIGGITAITEAATEAISLKNIEDARLLGAELDTKTVKDFVVNWATGAGINEAFGESVNEAIENLADERIMGIFSNHSDRIEAYMKTYGMGYDEANAAARQDELMGILHTALVSYISPGADIIQYATSRYEGYYAQSRNLQKLGYDVGIRDVRLQYAEERAAAKNDTHESGEINYDALHALQESIRQFEAEQAATSAKNDRKSGISAEGAGALQDAGAEQAAQDIAGNIRNLADASAVQRKNRNERTIVEQEMLASAAGHDRTAQTEAVAGVFGGISEEQREESNAAAMNLGNVYGKHANVASETQRLLVGAMLGGSDGDVVKLGLKYAALAGEKSAVYQAMQSPAYQDGDQAIQARIVEQAALQDMESDSVAEAAAKTVHDYRVAEVEKQLIADGALDSVNAAQAEADNAKSDTAKAAEALEQRNAEVDAANEALEAANSEFINDSGDHAKADQLVHAANEQKKAVAVQQEYQQSHDNAQERQTVAENKLEQTKGEATATLREQAETIVAKQDQERAETRAAEEQRVEEERIKAERQQAEENEKTGVAQEQRENDAIEAWLDSNNLQGDEREQAKQDMRRRVDEIKFGNIDTSKQMNDTEGILAVHSLSRRLNMPFVSSDTLPNGVRGMYSNGTVYLNSKLTVGQALVEASLHEITHSMEGSKSYGAYRNAVLGSLFGVTSAGDAQSLYDTSAEYRAAIDQKISEYKEKANQDLSIPDAEKEVIADFARTKLNDKDVVNRFIDNGLGGKIRNTLHNINQALKNFRLTGEERTQAEYLRRAERAFQKGIEEVSKTAVHPEGGQFSVAQIAQATGMTFDADALELRDAKGNVVDGVNNKITADMIDNTPVGMLIRNGLSNESTGVDENGNAKPSQQEAAREMIAGLMNMVARYRNSDLVWEIGATTLSSTFSALKSNSDPQYATTVDFGTICAKTQGIIDVMSQVMLDKIDPETHMLKDGAERGLSREEIMLVYNATHEAGLSVPCPVCYVFSRWMGVPSLLGQMSQFQADYVVTGEDGKTINVAETQKKVDEYIQHAEEKYGDAKGINNAKTKMQTRLAALEQNRTDLEAQLKDSSLSTEEKKTIQDKIDGVLADMTALDNDLKEVNAYNWITQALCKKNSDGTYSVDPAFEITPDDILFDLNRTGEFAGYKKNWKYRNTRGAGMGKAIMPYSGETIGDVLYGVKNTGRQNTIRNPWITMNESAAARQLKSAQTRAKKQNLVGGQRLQSTSDFRPEWGLDYVMSFLELQAAGSNVQMYTKVPEAVDFFASVGADVNLSIMGEGQGWHVDEYGNHVLDFSSVTGMDYNTAKDLKDKYDNVQMILVGMNDTHIRLALADEDIDFVIPWHSSGNSKDVLSSLISAVGEKLLSSVDYTTTQTDMVKGTTKKYKDENGNTVEYTVPGKQTEEQKALWDARVKLLNKGNKALTQSDREILLSNPYTKDLYRRFTEKGYDPACYGVTLNKAQASQIFPYEYWLTTETDENGNTVPARKENADVNGKRFVEYCEAMGIVPRFSQFKDDPGYWKLLIDRPMYNNDGTYHQQQVIDVTNARIGELDDSGKLTDSDLPTKAGAKYAPKDPRSDKYKEYNDRQNKAVEKSKAAIAEYNEKHNRVIEKAKVISEEQYDDGSNGESVFGTENGSQYSAGGDITNADLEQMIREAGTDYQSAAQRGDTEAAQEDLDFIASESGIDTSRMEPDEILRTAEGQYSAGGDNTLADLDQNIISAGALSRGEVNTYNANNNGSAVLEGQNPLATTAGGSAQRAFGNGMLQENDEMSAFVKRYVANQNGYTPDSNDAQIDRAIQWIASNKASSSSDGLYESIEKVASNQFDYRSADGQARMVALMGMAAYKNDVMAQVTLADAFNRQGTDLGRALQSRKLFRLMTPEGRIGMLQRMMTKTQEETGNTDLKFSEWIYRAAAAAETEEDFGKVRQAAAEELAEQIPASWKEKLNSWRMLSMLLNPRTHIRNIIGNAMFVPVVGLKNKMGAVIEMATGQERTKTLAPVLSKEVRDFARQDAEVMRNELTGEAKYAEGDLVQQERNKKQFKGLFQLLSDVNSNALEGEDWFFLKGHYRRALGGWMQANGYTAEQLQNNQELLDEGREYAISEAQKATYRDFNSVAAKLNGLTQNNHKPGEKGLGFLVNAVLPFRKTPANILKRGLEYSPIGIARSITTDLYHLHQYNEYQDGKLKRLPEDAISPTQYIDRLCSGLTGTGIMMMGAFLGSLGVASSGLGDDDDEFEKLRGNQPYSFKLNLLGHDVTFTMDWAAPASMPFFVGTAIYEQMQRENGMDIEQILNAMSNITEPVFNLSMLDGVNSLLGVQTSGNDSAIAQLGGKVVSNYVSSYIPSIVGAVARTVDDTRRKAFVESGKGGGIMGTFRYAGEQMENKIPGLSQTNIPYRDVWGNAETSSFGERLLENFILPGYLNQYNRNDAVVNELDRLYQETGNTDMIPRDANKTFSTTRTVNGEKTASEKYVLTAEQWDAYKTARGQAAYSTIEQMINTPEYQSAPDYEKVSMINEAWDYANQVGKRAVVPDATVDEYVSNGSDPVKAIIEKRAETIQKQTVSNHKSAMLKSLEEGKTEEFATMQEALRRDGKEENDIKGYVADKYRDAYKAAYLAGREDQMDAIKETLNSTGYEFDYAGWEKQAKKKQEEEEEKRRNGQ